MDDDFIKPVVPVVMHEKKDLTIRAESVKQDFRKYLDRNEINELLKKIPAGQNRMLCTFLWMSGVRITEAISIKKKDLDFENEVMTVRWLKSKKYHNRNVPLHPNLSLILYHYTGTMNQDDLVFPISRVRAYQITKQYMGISPHQLRHSFAVNWLRSKADIIILHKILGHSKLQTTMEYLKIVPADQHKELVKVVFS